MNNIFAIAFAVTSIDKMVIPSFKVGFILFWELLIYDMGLVYYTDVMVSVATNFDVPIKLMFPLMRGAYSILGLGDIVVPGVFIALCLNYDFYKFFILEKKNDINKISTAYFNWSFTGYCIGILMAFTVMQVFNHPQPALLYVVPACTFAVLIRFLFDCKNY